MSEKHSLLTSHLSQSSSSGSTSSLGQRSTTGGSLKNGCFKPVGVLTSGAKSILGLQKADPGGKASFSSSIGVALSMIGTTVGTGNIWRFPRIMASNAEEGGALVFLLIWLLFLFIWSIPLNLIQYGVGRYTKVCTVESFAKLIGPSYRWLGGFIVGTNLLIGAFYSVLLGYCGYYAFFFMTTSLPDTLETAESHFDDLLNSHWPVFFHIFFTVLASLALSRGVSTIEPVNRIIVPTLLVIVIFTLYWSMYLPYAGMGLIHMFTPSWKSFGNARIWRDALTQNAWDTAAGGGQFLAFATYMTRHQGAVKMGLTIPVINNFISLVSGMTVFCNVFSYEYQKGSSIEVIIDVLKTNGPFNTGITFVQMPLLYGSMNGGRILAVLFFIGVSLAGLSSLISILEQSVHVLEDFGIRRVPSTIGICILSCAMGLASALSSDIFINQDAVWAQALILCGCLFMFLAIRYGPLKFRRDLYNNFGIGDWSLPLLWVFLIVCICPIEGIGMILWWIIDELVNNSDPYYPNEPWWGFSTTSLFNILTQWTILLCIVFGLNWWMKPLNCTTDLSTHYPIHRTRTSWLTKFKKFSTRYLIHAKPPKLPTRPPDPFLSEDTESSSTSSLIISSHEVGGNTTTTTAAGTASIPVDDEVKIKESSLSGTPPNQSNEVNTNNSSGSRPDIDRTIAETDETVITEDEEIEAL